MLKGHLNKKINHVVTEMVIFQAKVEKAGFRLILILLSEQ